MPISHQPGSDGPFEARYLAFLETVAQLRPKLYRYCSRMTGSVLDGEDMVQEALFDAYRKLEQFDESRPLAPWLFRIAHNRCIDYLRRKKTRQQAEVAAASPDLVIPLDPPGFAIGQALEHLVLGLPPKERACLLLKDVFDCSLEEISDLLGSSVGAVKAALNRGRAKLATIAHVPVSRRTVRAETMQLLGLYIERFNNRDWNGLRELIAADARLQVIDAFDGKLSDSPYFVKYESWDIPWRMAAGEVNGEPLVILLQRGADIWTPRSLIHLAVRGGHIHGIVDYRYCPWMVEAESSIQVFAS